MAAIRSAATEAADYKLLIGGEWVSPARGGYDVINPATEELVGVAPEASVEQVRDAARAAKDAFAQWSRTRPEERAEILTRIADVVDKRRDELIPLVQAETGATLRVAATMQVPIVADRFRRYARGALEPNSIPLPPQAAEATALAAGGLIGAVAVRQPVGVVACITPYNFPIVNMAGKVAPALAMGNTVVVKPAPQDPLAVIALGEVFAEAGLPPGVVNIVCGSGPDVGQALVDSDDVDMISFTGSTSVGTQIAQSAARTMKRLLLELGGKGAAIVFDDADLKGAMGGIGSTWAFHSGQICTAPTRVIAHRKVYDELMTRLASYAQALKVGDPVQPDTVVGPLITAAHRDRVEGYIETGRAEAELLYGGSRPQVDHGWFVGPTLIGGCRAESTVAQEEIFGPVVVAIPFDDDDEAVAIANSTPFGLYDYVWSADAARAYRVAKQLRTGNVGVNTVARNQEAPFGGFKLSGVGRDGGSFGLYAYSELQSIVWST